MLSNMTFEAHHAQILSCFGEGASTWLIAQLVFPTFRLFSLIFFITLRMQLGLRHPSIAGIPQCVCTHPIDPMGIHLLCCAHGNECTGTHDVICDTFVAIARNANFHVGQEQCASFNHIQFFSSMNRHCVYQIWHSHFSRHCHLLPQSCATPGFAALDATQAKERIYHNRHPTNQFLPLAIEVFGCLHKHDDVFLHDYPNAIWSLKGTKGLHLAYLGHFFLSKSFNHITKDASVFHFKLGDSRRLSYFSTSTPSRHTSHHHGRPIASC
jgi:hypothetical protein